MKKFKKLSALLLAAIMILTMAVPALAEEKVGTVGAVPAATDRGTLMVQGIEGENATVVAYQIVKPVYNSSGLEKWEEAADYNTLLGIDPVAPATTPEPYLLDDEGKFTDDSNQFYLTQEKIAWIAAGIIDGTIPTTGANGLVKVDLTFSNGKYQNDNVAPGMYVVIVTPDEDETATIYNPAIASIYYSTEEQDVYEEDTQGTLYKWSKTGEDDVYAETAPQGDGWTNDGKTYKVAETVTNTILAMEKIPSFEDEWEINNPLVTVKKSEVTLTKEITTNSKNDAAEDSGKHGDDHGIGDIVYFKGTTKIPMFADIYFEQVDAQNNRKSPVYKIIDTMTEGLSLVQNANVFGEGENAYAIKITIGAHTVVVKAEDLTNATYPKAFRHLIHGGHEHDTYLNSISDRGFEFQLNLDAIKDHRGTDVTIEYAAYVMIDEFDPGFVGEENELKVEFSNDPTSLQEVTEIKDKTYHYTFNIDGSISGKTDEGQRQGHELIKTTEENFDWVSNTNKQVIKYDNGEETGYARLGTDGKFYKAEGTAPYKFIDKDGGASFEVFDAAKASPAVIWKETTYTTTGISGLDLAEFTLTMKKNDKGEDIPARPATAGEEQTAWDNKYTQKVLTKNGGYMTFTGLDAGVYELKETKAPAGYSTNTDVYTITISATYYDETVEAAEAYAVNNTDAEDVITEAEYNALGDTDKANYTFHNAVVATERGKLESYTVKRELNGQDVGTTTYEYSANGGVTETFTEAKGATFIKNTPLAELPSTGGMGTYLFTIAGVAILAVAAFMLIFKRRRA